MIQDNINFVKNKQEFRTLSPKYKAIQDASQSENQTNTSAFTSLSRINFSFPKRSVNYQVQDKEKALEVKINKKWNRTYLKEPTIRQKVAKIRLEAEHSLKRAKSQVLSIKASDDEPNEVLKGIIRRRDQGMRSHSYLPRANQRFSDAIHFLLDEQSRQQRAIEKQKLALWT